MGPRAWIPAASSHDTLRNKVNPSRICLHGVFPLTTKFKGTRGWSNKQKQARSIIDLLEKLVNGIPLVGGSTFERVEDKAQPAPDGMISAQRGFFSLPSFHLVPSLSLLVQGTKLCGLLVSSFSGSLPPLVDGRRSRTSLGDLLPSSRQEGEDGEGEGAEPTQTSVSTSRGGVGGSQEPLHLFSLSAQAQDKGNGEGRRAAWLCPESFLQPPGEEACYAGVDWSCVNPVWEYCQGRLQSRKYQEKNQPCQGIRRAWPWSAQGSREVSPVC